MILQNATSLWNSAAVYAGQIAAIAGMLYGTWRYVVRPFIVRPLILGKEERALMMKKITEISISQTATAEVINKELAHNGGGSIKDVIAAIQRAVHITQQRMLAIQDDAEYGMFVADPKGAKTFVNRTMSVITERPAADLLGWAWVNALSYGCRDKVREEWDEAMEQERPFVSEHEYITPSGIIKPVRVVSYPVRDTKGNICEHVGTVRLTREFAHKRKTDFKCSDPVCPLLNSGEPKLQGSA